MRVAVVGGGLAGLSATVTLGEKGIHPVIFESSGFCGGLAKGFNPGKWNWSLEIFYHHIFTNDKDIIQLAKKVNCNPKFYSPTTTSFYRGKETDLDSPVSMLRFSGVSVPGRIRMGIGLLILKIIPNGIFLEKFKATKLLPKLIGEEGYNVIWKKLIYAKFGPYSNEVNMAWFWSRVKKRTKKLGYFQEGFENLINVTEKYIQNNKGEIRLNSPVNKIVETETGVKVNGEDFDAVIMTLPAPEIEKVFPKYKFPDINYLWGQTLILETSNKLIRGYWMNILEENYPFLVAVEHTNMINKKNYNNNRIIYLGNYLPQGSKQLSLNKEQLLRLYLPFLKKINKNFNKKYIRNIYLFRQPYAQPVFPTNYSHKIPNSSISKRVFIANMSMVYPYDRGTNYAVKIGKDVAENVINKLR